jgi:hypothetical protein
MTTHLPQPDGQLNNATSTGEEHQAAMSSQPLTSQQVVLPERSEEEEDQSFYVFNDEQPGAGIPFAVPFQISQPMPPAFAPAQPAGQTSAAPPPPTLSPAKTGRQFPLSLPIIGIVVCLVVIVGLLVMSALAQTTPPLQTQEARSSQTQPSVGASGKQQPAVKPSPAPTAPARNGTKGQGQGQASTDWVPQQLPAGWTNAGLQMGDALQAIRTAVTFTDREMSLDYRSVGTRNNHGGTFTAATFIMTPAAMLRFQQNDVRAINNTLFDMVVNAQLIRLVVDPQPQLVKFAQQGQQQFAWVDVSFQLWQSQVDPNNPQQRIEGKELDPATKQPRIHHMIVLLLRVPQQDEGANPPMGGTAGSSPTTPWICQMARPWILCSLHSIAIFSSESSKGCSSCCSVRNVTWHTRLTLLTRAEVPGPSFQLFFSVSHFDAKCIA